MIIFKNHRWETLDDRMMGGGRQVTAVYRKDARYYPRHRCGLAISNPQVFYPPQPFYYCTRGAYLAMEFSSGTVRTRKLFWTPVNTDAVVYFALYVTDTNGYSLIAASEGDMTVRRRIEDYDAGGALISAMDEDFPRSADRFYTAPQSSARYLRGLRRAIHTESRSWTVSACPVFTEWNGPRGSGRNVYGSSMRPPDTLAAAEACAYTLVHGRHTERDQYCAPFHGLFPAGS